MVQDYLAGGIGVALFICALGAGTYLENTSQAKIAQVQAEKAKYEYLTVQAQLQLNTRTNKVSTLEQ